jgi:hypothetical protein
VIDFQNIKLSPALNYTLRSMTRGKNYSGNITNSCNLPLTQVSVDANSDCFLCNCEGYLPVPVGKVNDFESLEQVWNSPIALMLQDDIQQKKFSWCAVTHCGIINQNIKNDNYSLSINIDDSCNLACPSCRRELRMLENGPEFEQKYKDLTRILEWLEKFNHPINISLGGTGDAFASQLIRNFIKNYKYKSGQTFTITTNGLLLKKVIVDSAIRPAITNISISIDAASKDVYEQVRRPGKWSVLMDNLTWLVDNRQNSRVNLNFVLQKTNFRDLPAFADLCRQLNFSGNIMALNDWGTWNTKPVVDPDEYTIVNGTYLDHDVAAPGHPEHSEFIQVLKSVREKNFKFLKFNSYFDKFK